MIVPASSSRGVGDAGGRACIEPNVYDHVLSIYFHTSKNYPHTLPHTLSGNRAPIDKIALTGSALLPVIPAPKPAGNAMQVRRSDSGAVTGPDRQ
jgi:hypothetical protein